MLIDVFSSTDEACGVSGLRAQLNEAQLVETQSTADVPPNSGLIERTQPMDSWVQRGI